MTLLKRSAAAMLAVLVTGTLAGCGGGGTDTGAGTDVTVKVKPSELEAADSIASTATGGGDAPAAGAASDGGTESGGTGPGTLKGRVLFSGSFTQENLYGAGAAIKDAEVCAAEPIPDEAIVVNDGGLANVFIYLERAPRGAEVPEPGEEPLQFDNLKCRFVPHALLMQTGQTIRVTNSDAVAHNTHTFPARNDPFNSVLKVNDTEGIPFTYKRSEKVPVQVKCDLHAWMKAWHLPLDHPYGAGTSENGTFEIAGLPPGKHKFRIWHETAGYLDRGYEVTMPGGKDVDVKISYGQGDLAQFRGPQPRMVTLTVSR